MTFDDIDITLKINGKMSTPKIFKKNKKEKKKCFVKNLILIICIYANKSHFDLISLPLASSYVSLLKSIPYWEIIKHDNTFRLIYMSIVGKLPEEKGGSAARLAQIPRQEEKIFRTNSQSDRCIKKVHANEL